MPQLETILPDQRSALIDLRGVERQRRATVWDGAARSAFPGLSVRISSTELPIGLINRIDMGAGDLFAIESAPAEISFLPGQSGRATPPHISLMVQAKGATLACQGGQSCLLQQGDACLIDEANAFQLVGEDCSNILLLRLPRGDVMSRNPQLGRHFAKVLPAHEAGTKLLVDLLIRLQTDALCLDFAQRAAMLGGVVHMVGAALPSMDFSQTVDWRVRRALDFIELNLSVAGLTANAVASSQRISRRRLDQIMRQVLGHSISSYLWSRRLERAATDLRDPRCARSSIAQVAFANGFEDAAHFTRAFKRRFEVTPGQWRLN